MKKQTNNTMTTIATLIDLLDAELHPEYQENYDNAGFLLGDPTEECRGVLVALDVTDDVIEEAIEKGANMIVTHHPMIFGNLKRITPANALGRYIFKLIKNNISVYAAHTNLDNLKHGVNGILAEILGLTDCHILRQLAGQPSPDVGAGMVGRLPYPMPTVAFLEQVKMSLGLPLLRTSGIVNPVVDKVAVCGGAGNFLIDDAKAQHADIYLTGDLKYHDFQRAEGDIILADIGHFESEQFSKELIYSIISKKFSNFACFISHRGKSFVNYI
ncbi:MAG: Nif3-like dinuclear metal center hexameric protein [Bacteroidales bacterium]|nr:Nif3-like dinuclear metal center hexameric protein [Bacteroidales bacterium]